MSGRLETSERLPNEQKPNGQKLSSANGQEWPGRRGQLSGMLKLQRALSPGGLRLQWARFLWGVLSFRRGRLLSGFKL